MAGKHITPTQKTEALTLRAGGNTITVISDKTGISVSTLKRLFREHRVSKGRLKKEAVQKATDALIHDANAIEEIKREIAALIVDDVAIAKRLRQTMVEATDHLIPTNTTEALQVMRAISSGAVALKSTSETLRKSLGIDKDGDINDELPELLITVMTKEEIETVKESARNRLVGVDDGLGGMLEDEDEEENDVLVFGVDEEETTSNVVD